MSSLEVLSNVALSQKRYMDPPSGDQNRFKKKQRIAHQGSKPSLGGRASVVECSPTNVASLVEVENELMVKYQALFRTPHPLSINALDDAARVTEAALKRFPRSAIVLCMVGEVLKSQSRFLKGEARKKKLEQARSYLSLSTQIAPRRAFVWRALGYLSKEEAGFLEGEEEANKLEAAKTYFIASLAFSPKCAHTLGALGEVLMLQAYSLEGKARVKKLQDAEEKLEQSLKLDYSGATRWGFIGEVLRLQAYHLEGKASVRTANKAEKILRYSLKLDRQNDVFGALSELLWFQALFLSGAKQTKKLEEARKKLEEYLNACPARDLEAELKLVDVLRLQAIPLARNAKKTKLEEARVKLEKCSQAPQIRESTKGEILRLRGDIARMEAELLNGNLRTVKLTDAKAAFQASLKIAPKHPFALQKSNVVLEMERVSSAPAA